MSFGRFFIHLSVVTLYPSRNTSHWAE